MYNSLKLIVLLIKFNNKQNLIIIYVFFPASSLPMKITGSFYNFFSIKFTSSSTSGKNKKSLSHPIVKKKYDSNFLNLICIEKGGTPPTPPAKIHCAASITTPAFVHLLSMVG